ncbi:hypothetical protein C8F01DRAFT_455079 [Mycena amicta]|nr:hypothetical protein C8F01DRAFT_455079 [Mycena amicta]
MASPSSFRGSPDNSAKLQRGQACFNCRRRKRKCDGLLPCGQCTRLDAEDECEYMDPGKRPVAHILQEQIDELQNRISHIRRGRAGGSHSHRSSSSPVLGSSSPSPAQSIWNNTPTEPPPTIIAELIDTFLAYASEFGFFLNPSRFRDSALLALPFGDYSRPTPALLSCVYLWGLRLSMAHSPTHSPASSASSSSTSSSSYSHHGPLSHPDEPAYLGRALALTSKGLSSSGHPQRILHTLQAEVLLAYYFFACGRVVEAKYHTAAAVSLSLSSGLHQIRSTNVPPSNALPPPVDAVEEGERIHAWWAVLVMDRCFAVGLSEMPSISSAQLDSVDTPWPLEPEDYSTGAMYPHARYSRTIETFLSSSPDTATLSTPALLAKAAILFQRTDEFVRTWKPGLGHDMMLHQLSALVDSFRNSLPPPTALPRPPTPATTRALVVAHSIAHAAAVRLHGLYPHTKVARLAAARSVLGIIAAVPLKHIQWINPIMGTVWSAAGEVFLEEIASMQAVYHGVASDEEVNLRAFVARAGPSLRVFERNCSLMRAHPTPSDAGKP